MADFVRVSTSAQRPHLEANAARELIAECVERVGVVLRGQRQAVRLVLAAVFARGHVLIEDVPGVGKTTLARAVARALGCEFSRVQFTADMLPSDLLGVHLWKGDSQEFTFKRGPIFSDIVLADEINRAPPKTQSAMLEAMAERRVSTDDKTYALPAAFTVLATQNPVEHHGAYPLPESQLDRFALRISLGYPSLAEERSLLVHGHRPELLLDTMLPVLDPVRLGMVHDLVDQVTLGEPIGDYILALVQATRSSKEVSLGCSPRASLSMASLARAWAFMEGRAFVNPDDIQLLAPYVLAHRLVMGGVPGDRSSAVAFVDELLNQTAVPR